MLDDVLGGLPGKVARQQFLDQREDAAVRSFVNNAGIVSNQTRTVASEDVVVDELLSSIGSGEARSPDEVDYCPTIR